MTARLTMIQVFLSIAIPLTLGVVIVTRLLQARKPAAFLIALGYGCGMGLLGQWMLFLDSLRIPLSLFSIGGPLVLLSTGLFFHKKRASPAQTLTVLPLEDSRLSLSARIAFCCGLAYLVYIGFYVFWRSLTVPILEWDCLSSIAFKAKVVFFNRHLADPQTLPKSGYPLQVPFMMSWVAFNLGEWHEITTKIVFPFFFLSFLGIFTHFLRVFVSRLWTLGGLVLLVSSNLFILHATIAYRDFTLMFFNCATILLLLLYLRDSRTGLLILAALFSGFTAFTKLEGNGYLFVHVLTLAFILREKFRNNIKAMIKPFMFFILISGGMTGAYYLVKILTGVMVFNGRLQPDTVISFPWRAKTIFIQFLSDLFMSQNWNVVWMVLALSLLGRNKFRARPEARLLLIALTASFLMLFVVGMYSSSFIWIAGEKSDTTLSRVILHFYPLAPALTILLLAPATKGPFKKDNTC